MNKPECEWLLFLTQLPAEPSSARVAIWRRLKTAGASTLLTGTWVLPNNVTHEQLLGQLAANARAQGGSAAVFAANVIDGMSREQIIERFQADRAREYHEFHERAEDFQVEVAKETAVEKFTFAELEELEHDFDKQRLWLTKILARDFFPNYQKQTAEEKLDHCSSLLRGFADMVYAHDGAHVETEG